MHSILTVTVAADSYDLTDLATVKEEMSISGTASDAMLARWITEESARIADYCGRVFPVETVSETYRFFGWRRREAEALILSRRPVTAIASVTADDVVVDEADYELDAASGLLYRIGGGFRCFWWGCKIVVAYSAGYSTIPLAVSQACLTLIKHRWSARTRDPSLRSITIENVGQKVFWVGGTGDVGDMPPEVAAALERYREIRV